MKVMEDRPGVLLLTVNFDENKTLVKAMGVKVRACSWLVFLERSCVRGSPFLLASRRWASRRAGAATGGVSCCWGVAHAGVRPPPPPLPPPPLPPPPPLLPLLRGGRPFPLVTMHARPLLLLTPAPLLLLLLPCVCPPARCCPALLCLLPPMPLLKPTPLGTALPPGFAFRRCCPTLPSTAAPPASWRASPPPPSASASSSEWRMEGSGAAGSSLAASTGAVGSSVMVTAGRGMGDVREALAAAGEQRATGWKRRRSRCAGSAACCVPCPTVCASAGTESPATAPPAPSACRDAVDRHTTPRCFLPTPGSPVLAEFPNVAPKSGAAAGAGASASAAAPLAPPRPAAVA